MTKQPHDHRAFLELSFAQERDKLVKRLWQIRQDVDSYNENQAEPAGLAPLVFVFDFRSDMDELDAVRLLRARMDLPDAPKREP